MYKKYIQQSFQGFYPFMVLKINDLKKIGIQFDF
jgi:hypothetical protein